MLSGRKILLCVTGGIASYKAVTLTSQLVQAGAEVKVAMTESATKFVTPLTFQVLSQNEVYTDTFIENNPKVIAHVDIAQWADLIIVVPATANTIGKIVAGIADNIVVTTLLATLAPVWIAPAMNVEMYNHRVVQANFKKLIKYNYKIIEPGEGFLACGQVGKGRLAEPETIINLIKDYFSEEKQILANKNIVITAGPTRERIDPVRFITNFSSGKMGYALAEQAVKLGANVTLISGPTTINKPEGVNFVQIESAQQMYEAVLHNFAEADIVIKAAAVADYRPKETHSSKMKKTQGNLNIEMERTIDILATLGQKKNAQLLVGFAAETDDLTENAQSKLQEKNCDYIVANDISATGVGFGYDTNKVTIFKRDGSEINVPLLSKDEIARKILQEIHIDLKDD